MSSGNQRPSILKRMSIVGGLSSAALKAKPPAPAPSPPRLGPDASIEERRAQFPAQWPKDAEDHFPDAPQGELELKKGIVASEAMRRLSTSDIDDMYSGTTAISVFCDRGTLYVSNVGDSRTMLGTATEDGGVGCEALSFDHTPYRSDERERVKQQGARVLSFDQVHGRRPLGESWDVKLGEEVDDVGDPPRVWDDSLETPGTAFTRSIGDSVAETLGIFAEPEVFTHDLKPSDRVIIVASDGVFEFLTMKQCVEIAMLYDDPEQAARALVGEAYKMWITRELRSDDITIVVAYVEPPSLERRDSTSVNSPVDTADNVDPAKSPRRASGSFYADENGGSPEPRRRSPGGPNGGADVVEIALDEGPVVNFKRDLRRLMLQCSSFCDANAAY
ncbi:protein serine/threonine phosphatase [Aureococcus anophagefferens]|nr:protein serine/threonine phosphatase [Aureococcus anophagefferens]